MCAIFDVDPCPCVVRGWVGDYCNVSPYNEIRGCLLCVFYSFWSMLEYIIEHTTGLKPRDDDLKWAKRTT